MAEDAKQQRFLRYPVAFAACRCAARQLTIMPLGWWQVRDAVFLHGYNEPTLLLLHETEATWSGFACERKDT